MMQCEQCGKNPAVASVSLLEGNKKVWKYLCNDCISQLIQTNLATNPFSPLNFFSGFINPQMVDEAQDLVCDHCGTSFSRFRQTGRFGCAQCYDAFGDKLAPIFRKLQYSDTYVGKSPDQRGKGGLARERLNLASLEDRLQQAVEREDYEQAAALKREIDQMKGGAAK